MLFPKNRSLSLNQTLMVTFFSVLSVEVNFYCNLVICEVERKVCMMSEMYLKFLMHLKSFSSQVAINTYFWTKEKELKTYFTNIVLIWNPVCKWMKETLFPLLFKLYSEATAGNWYLLSFSSKDCQFRQACGFLNYMLVS